MGDYEHWQQTFGKKSELKKTTKFKFLNLKFAEKSSTWKLFEVQESEESPHPIFKNITETNTLEKSQWTQLNKKTDLFYRKISLFEFKINK